MHTIRRDPRARPPDSVKQLFKTLRQRDPFITDTISRRSGTTSDSDYITTSSGAIEHIVSKNHKQVMFEFCKGEDSRAVQSPCLPQHELGKGYEVSSLPGLYVLPAFLSPQTQVALLERLLHRDLSSPSHKTNLHLHYKIPVPSAAETSVGHGESPALGSFFGVREDELIHPKDPAIHKPITLRQMLDSKLRWVTLGGQYDWTNKVYPPETPPAFPADIALLLKGLFPDIDAQAAIVNFYSPGDTLSVHRDVSEECDNSLISISIGCDALFIAGNEDGSCSSTLKLGSGDVLVMSGESRYAWHAVPKIIPGTCPAWLSEWPASSNGGKYNNWRGWMSRKRINLNIRQMTDADS